MKIVSFITEAEVVRKILEHLGLRAKTATNRSLPESIPERRYELIDDGWPQYLEPFVTVH